MSNKLLAVLLIGFILEMTWVVIILTYFYGINPDKFVKGLLALPWIWLLLSNVTLVRRKGISF